MPALDGRVWLLWMIAASVIPLLSRNPVLLAEVLLIVLIVSLAWQPVAKGMRMAWLIRLSVVFGLIGVVFNLLTVHTGGRVLFTIPETWPIVGGMVTLNALVYGLCSALALVLLVLIAMTVASLVDWMELLAFLPRRLAGVAVACSVAWSFLPQIGISFRQIREAQQLRGQSVDSFRQVAPLLIPLLSTALERALITAEAMESRGYGVSLDTSGTGSRGHLPWSGLVLIGGLVSGLVSGFALSTGSPAVALVFLAIAAGSIALSFRTVSGSVQRSTRFRVVPITLADRTVGALMVVALLAIMSWRIVRPADFAFEPYPDLTLPLVSPGLMALLGLLIAPAVVSALAPGEPRIHVTHLEYPG